MQSLYLYFHILFLVHVLFIPFNDLQGMQAPGPSTKWSISIFTLKFRAHARAPARNFKVKIEIDHFFTPGSPKGALYSYLHVHHIYMSIIYTCPIQIHVRHIYMFNIYTCSTYIESIYSTHICQKNTVLFKKWTYRWSLDTFMDSKLINFLNDLIFWSRNIIFY